MLTPEAFSAEYVASNSPLIRFLALRTPSIDMAEEVASETWLRAWKYRGQFSGENGCSFRTWIFKIGINCLREYRRYQRAPIRSGVHVSEAAAGQLAARNHDPSWKVDAAQLFRQLHPRVQAIAKMRFVLGYTEVEVAEMFGVPVGTIKAQSSRGFNRQRQEL